MLLERAFDGLIRPRRIFHDVPEPTAIDIMRHFARFGFQEFPVHRQEVSLLCGGGSYKETLFDWFNKLEGNQQEGTRPT